MLINNNPLLGPFTITNLIWEAIFFGVHYEDILQTKSTIIDISTWERRRQLSVVKTKKQKSRVKINVADILSGPSRMEINVGDISRKMVETGREKLYLLVYLLLTLALILPVENSQLWAMWDKVQIKIFHRQISHPLRESNFSFIS